MSKKTIRESSINEVAIATQLQSIVCGRFEWFGLPERLTSIQLERFISLWDSNGLAVGFSDPTGGPMILPGYPSGDFDVYWLPRSFTVTGALFDRVIDSDECVPFYDNPSRSSILPLFNDTVKTLSLIWSVMATNVRQQRNPYVFGGTKTEIETLREALRRRDEGDEVLAVTQTGLSTIETAKRFFPIRPEFLGSAMMEHYTQVLNRFLTALGIDNVPIMKRERLNSQEAEANNQLILYNRDAQLRMRTDAAQAFNARFGAAIEVKWKGGVMNREVSAADGPEQPGI